MATLSRNVVAEPATRDDRDGAGHPHDGQGGHNDNGRDGDRGGGGGGRGGGGEAWVTVATFSISAAAHLARLKLEGEDVPCVIVDEHVIATTWVLAPALGGIKLQVPAEYLEHARAILGEESPAVAATGWEAQAAAAAQCQVCGKGEYALAKPPLWAVLISILALGIPLLFLPKTLKCDLCGAVYRH